MKCFLKMTTLIFCLTISFVTEIQAQEKIIIDPHKNCINAATEQFFKSSASEELVKDLQTLTTKCNSVENREAVHNMTYPELTLHVAQTCFKINTINEPEKRELILNKITSSVSRSTSLAFFCSRLK